MKAEYVNPFISATSNVVKQVMQVDVKRGQLGLKKVLIPRFDLIIRLDVTGDLSGSVVYSMSGDSAKNFASLMMMGMPVVDFDELAKSAINELANMITGNAISLLSSYNFSVDITPPKLEIIKEKKTIIKLPSLVIPIHIDPHGILEINVSINGAEGE